MPNKILIISHTFPPSPGIGGRRWVKFAKYLLRNKHTVHVLAAENIHTATSPWQKDIENVNVEYLPYNYPRSLTLPVNTFMAKVTYRLSLLKVKVMGEGNYYDKAIFWEKQIQKKVREYIKLKGSDTIIVTGAPFRLVYFVTQLKKEYPNVTFIADFRDLWTNDTELSAIKSLSEERKLKEIKFEKEAVTNSDYVFTVAEKMRTHFASLSSSDKCILVPNGFDPDDFIQTNLTHKKAEKKSTRVNFVFAGTVYNNLDYILVPFFDGLQKLKNENPELYKLINFEFYGKFPEKYKNYIRDKGLLDTVLVRGEETYAKVSEKLYEAHYGVLFLNDLYNYSFSTKFCEYIAQKKKMIVVSSSGITADYIVKNNLGIHITPANTLTGISEAIERVKRNNFLIERNEDFDNTVFAIPEITRNMEKFFHKNN